MKTRPAEDSNKGAQLFATRLVFYGFKTLETVLIQYGHHFFNGDFEVLEEGTGIGLPQLHSHDLLTEVGFEGPAIAMKCPRIFLKAFSCERIAGEGRSWRELRNGS